MAAAPDPFRTLGLHPGASVEEIRRAYRRLAKANHPDSAGEAALPRFLAIQAAYESLVGTGPGRARRPGSRQTAGPPPPPASPPRDPWRPDPDRARTTREGSTRRPGSRPPSGAPGGAGDQATGARRTPPPPPAGGSARREGRKRASNKATPGSTSYDAAEDEPFEPEWSGGTWYGASSGTYWTINPKEYADPRKHGPEYQRRAHRRVDEGAGTDPDGPGSESPDAGSDPASASEPLGTAADSPRPGRGPARRAEAGPRPWDFPESAQSSGPAPGEAAPAARHRDGTRDDQPDAPVGPDTGRTFPTLPDGFLAGFGGRVALALVGWPPIGLAIATLAGEMTGCTRFAATCVDVFGIGTWLVQVVIIAVLLAIPALAAISATGTVFALAAAVPAAVVLSASGGSREPAASAAVLGTVLAAAYVVGVGVAIARRVGIRRVPWPG